MKKLTPEEKRVIIDKGTERPFTGEYVDHKEEGYYLCKQCGETLFHSSSKFKSGTGWPSFDEAIPGKVKEVPDADGRRVEIVCAGCGAHLGHVFRGEGFTEKNARNCVNSICLDFQPAENEATRRAYFAGGCFWGVEFYLQQEPGVLSVISGYSGGKVDNPSYQQVCTGSTGHAEAVEVVYDPTATDFETLARLFFEIHDPTQVDRQGPDIGNQYRSVVFYTTKEEREITRKLIRELKNNGFKVATEVDKFERFWPAEEYHQDYYFNKGTLPYCHSRVKRF